MNHSLGWKSKKSQCKKDEILINRGNPFNSFCVIRLANKQTSRRGKTWNSLAKVTNNNPISPSWILFCDNLQILACNHQWTKIVDIQHVSIVSVSVFTGWVLNTASQSGLRRGCRQSLANCGRSLTHSFMWSVLVKCEQICFLSVDCTLSNHMLSCKLRSIWRWANNFVQQQHFCTTHSQVSGHSCRLCSIWWKTEAIWDTVLDHLGTGRSFYTLSTTRQGKCTIKTLIYYDILAFF